VFKFSKNLKPVNRYVTIIPHYPSKTDTAVLLPEDYKPQEERYITATVLNVASDCASDLKKLRTGYQIDGGMIVVDKNMIEEFVVSDKKYHAILENYILGILRGLDED